MIPFARELLRMGAEVVMVANSQPAINDITSAELRTLLEDVASVCPVIKVRAAPSESELEAAYLCLVLSVTSAELRLLEDVSSLCPVIRVHTLSHCSADSWRTLCGTAEMHSYQP